MVLVNRLRAPMLLIRSGYLPAGLALLAISACAPAPGPHPDLPQLRISTGFTSRNMCALGVSPAVNVANAPADTARYTVRISNVDVLYQTPWQETVPAAPNGIPEGAAPSFEAPCLGETQGYTYRVEVLARDANDRPLAYGRTQVYVGSLAQTVEAERRSAQGIQPPFRAPPPPPSSMMMPSIGGPNAFGDDPRWNPAGSGFYMPPVQR